MASLAHVDIGMGAFLAFLAALGFVASLVALGSVLREGRALARRLREARHLNEMLRLDDDVHSPALCAHYEACLGEAIGGFEIRNYARSPEVEREVDAYLRRLKDAGDRR